MAKYQLTIDEDQLEALRKATEAYSRICTLQVSYALEEGWDLFKLPALDREVVDRHCKGISKALSGGKMDGHGGSYGIYSLDINKNAAIAYNLNQVIRHQQWKEIPEDTRPKHVVSSSVSVCNGEAPATLEKIED
jgi:hypothetical protein